MLLCRSISDRSRTRESFEFFPFFLLLFGKRGRTVVVRRYLKVASKILIQAHTYMQNANESYWRVLNKYITKKIQGSINTIEGLITSYGTPVVGTVQKTYPKVVTNIDKKVDGVLTAVQSVWENRVKASYPAKAVTSVSTAIQTQREQFPENIAYLKSLTTKEKRENYLKFIELKIQELQSATKEVPQLAYDAIKTAIKNAREKLDSFELLKKVDELWQATLNLKQVKTVVKAKEDLSQKVQEKATEVSNNAYVKKATKSVNEVVQTVQSKVKGKPTPKESRVEEMD